MITFLPGHGEKSTDKMVDDLPGVYLWSRCENDSTLIGRLSQAPRHHVPQLGLLIPTWQLTEVATASIGLDLGISIRDGVRLNDEGGGGTHRTHTGTKNLGRRFAVAESSWRDTFASLLRALALERCVQALSLASVLFSFCLSFVSHCWVSFEPCT